MVDARLPAEWLGAPRYENLSDRAFRTLAGALMWSNAHGTDGKIPLRCTRLLHPEGDSTDAFTELETAGYWRPCNDGFELLGWAEDLHQSTAADIERYRAGARERKRRQRGHSVTAAVTRDNDRDNDRDTTGDVMPDVGSGSLTTTTEKRASHTRDATPELTQDVTGEVTRDTITSPFCTRHPSGTTEPCGGCARARTALENQPAPTTPDTTRRAWDCELDGHKLVIDGSCAICTHRENQRPIATNMSKPARR